MVMECYSDTLVRMRELFASDDFNLKDFLTSRPEIPIESLLKQLDEIHKTVQNELFDLINGDLEHFQNVIKEVCKVEVDLIKQYRASFEQDKLRKEENYLKYKEYFEEVDKRYQRLKYVQKKKDLIVRSRKARQYIENFKVRQIKAESSIFELEIAVQRYNWLLKFTTDHAEELLESDSDINRELSLFSERLQEILEIHMKRILSVDTASNLETNLLLNLCQETNKMNLFEASYKLSIVYPSLELFLQSSISFTGAPINFTKFLEQVSSLLKSLKSSWNEIIKKFYLEEYKFWTRTVLIPVLTWILERCSSVFNPINLEEFKINFERGLNFVSEIENEFFFYEEDLIFFRSQPGWINFMKKWPLHQYYQSRIKQFIAPIEISLVDSINFDHLELKVFESTLVTINALNHLWADEVILKPLIPKFLKITLQVFRRFMKFCSTEDLKTPKTFLLSFIQKQYNLKQFVALFEENVKYRLQKHLDILEAGLSENILKKLEEESDLVLMKSRANLIPVIERLYDQIINKEDFKSLNLESLKILKESEIPVEYDLNQLIQQILLKFNRIIFKLIDEKRLNVKEREFLLERMKEIEGEAEELGYSELINEEFWLEIKVAIN